MSQEEKPIEPMEDAFDLTGYNAAQRIYYGYVATICCVFGIVFYFLNMTPPIPLLLVLAILFSDLWWQCRNRLTMKPQGLNHGKDWIPWEKIQRYITWGPVRVPLTPIQLQGITLYTQNKKRIFLGGNAPGYALLLQALRQRLPAQAPQVWHSYPSKVVRFLRYFAAFAFAVVFLTLAFFQWLIVLAATLGVGYWAVQRWRRSREHTKQGMHKYFWLTAIGGAVALALGLYLFESIFSHVLVGVVPVLLLLFLPWRLPPVAIIEGRLFVGLRRAYPLRLFQTQKEISKLVILKIWHLDFQGGSVEIYPFLEGLEEFRKNFEKNLVEAQSQPHGNEPFSGPKKEAKRLLRSNSIPPL